MALRPWGGLVQMARNTREMVDHACAVNGFIATEQIGRSRRHVQKPPSAIVDPPCWLARLHAIGQQPRIRNLCRNWRTFTPVCHSRQIPQPIKAVNIIGQRWLQIELVIIQITKCLLKALIVELANAQRLTAGRISLQRVLRHCEQALRHLAS